MSEADLTPVSVESSDGRVLTGVGTTPEALEKTMERHAPAESPARDQPIVPTGEPKPSRGARRFDELTREREDAKREAEAAKKEAADLRAQLAQRATPAAPAVPSPAATEPAAAAAPSPPEKFTFPTYDAYLTTNPEATWEDWLDAKEDARTDWKLAKTDFDARIRQGIEADRASRTFTEHVVQIKTKAREVYPDFDTVLDSGPGANVELGEPRVHAILAQPHAEHMLYAIAKSDAVATWLKGLSEIEFGQALARFAVPADAAVASPASTAPRVPVTAPAPYQPVGSGSKTAALSSADLPKKAGYDFDKSGYREKRAAERGVKIRR